VNQEAWPTPQGPSREPLPRVEDLPVAEQGYDQASVRAAFDSFYRHAAQLDTALRTLEAVDSFHRQAAALRADLRTLRTAGWSQQPWAATPPYAYSMRAAREGISPAVWRIAGEAALLIAVAVGLGVAKVSWWLIVLVMGAAWLVVGLIEWAASRDRWSAPVAVEHVAHPVVDAPPVDQEPDDAHGWSAFERAQEPSDAMTMIGAPPQAESHDDQVDEPASEPVAEQPARAGIDDAPAHDAELQKPRRRWWHRAEKEPDEAAAIDAVELPHHVRVLPPGEAAERDDTDPWERGFDAVDDVDDAEQTDAGNGRLSAGPDADRRRFRRR
jgi:hypothetical protein